MVSDHAYRQKNKPELFKYKDTVTSSDKYIGREVLQLTVLSSALMLTDIFATFSDIIKEEAVILVQIW